MRGLPSLHARENSHLSLAAGPILLIRSQPRNNEGSLPEDSWVRLSNWPSFGPRLLLGRGRGAHAGDHGLRTRSSRSRQYLSTYGEHRAQGAG